MRLLQFLKEFEITLSGGFAWYALLCIGFVTVVGTAQIIGVIIKHLS